MALFPDRFDTLPGLQQALDAFRVSSWLGASLSGGGAFPPLNVFRKGEDFVIIAEVPGVKPTNIDVHAREHHPCVRHQGCQLPRHGQLHRRERLAGRLDRTMTLPVEVEADGVRAECRDDILALFLPRAERDKPKSIKVA